jgi:argininosuccinate lyase
MTTEKEFNNLWGGRFSEKNDPVFEEYNKSINFDKTMCQSDIEGSKGKIRKMFNF